jgi:hypothetical protein
MTTSTLAAAVSLTTSHVAVFGLEHRWVDGVAAMPSRAGGPREGPRLSQR